MSHQLFQLIVILAVLLIAGWIIQRWAPDPLLAKIGMVIIFLIALYVIFTKLLPIAGLSF